MAAWGQPAGRGFGAAPAAGFGAAPAAGFGAAPAAGFGAAPAAGFGAAPAAGGFGRGAAPAAGFGAAPAAGGFGAPAAAAAGGFGRAAAPAAGGFGAAAAPAAGGPGGFGAAAASQDHELRDVGTDCISSVVWSPANCPKVLIASTSWDKNVRVWEVQGTKNGALVSSVASQPLAMQAHSAPLLCCALGSDGSLFYGGCCKTAMMLNLGQAGSPPQQIAAHDMPISCMAFVETGAPAPVLATGSWDGKVRFWDLRQSTPVKEENLGVPVIDMDCSRTPLAAFLTARKAAIYNLQTMAMAGEADPHASCVFQMRKIGCFPNHTAIATGTVDGRLSFSPVNSTQTQYSTQFRAQGAENPTTKVVDCYQINFVAVSHTNNTVISGGSDGLINFFDMNAKSRFAQVPAKVVQGKPIAVSCGALYHDSTMLAYGLSYDWASGRAGFNPQAPTAIFVKAIQSNQMR